MLQSHYGNISGLDDLFKTFLKIEGAGLEKTDVIAKGVVAEIFRSHPFSEDRWVSLYDLAEQKGWQVEGKQRALQFPSESTQP
jgi:predicted Zn-dependent protease